MTKDQGRKILLLVTEKSDLIFKTLSTMLVRFQKLYFRVTIGQIAKRNIFLCVKTLFSN